MLRDACAAVVVVALWSHCTVRAVGSTGEKEKWRRPEDMRCCERAVIRDAEEKARKQAKGAGKGQSSTGSDSAASTAKSEDDARIAELKEDIRTCREEVRAMRKELTELSREFMSVQATVEDWGRWYNK